MCGWDGRKFRERKSSGAKIIRTPEEKEVNPKNFLLSSIVWVSQATLEGNRQNLEPRKGSRLRELVPIIPDFWKAILLVSKTGKTLPEKSIVGILAKLGLISRPNKNCWTR